MKRNFERSNVVLHFSIMKNPEVSPIPVISNPFVEILNRLNYIESLLHDLTPPEKPTEEKIDPTKKVFGIKGLCKFINCSEPTAVKLARSGRFPRYQDGRKIFFYEADILKSMKRTSVNS
jgi:hypothetical protein